MTKRFGGLDVIKRILLSVLTLSLIFNGLVACAIHYKDIPDIPAKPKNYSVNKKMYYRVMPLPVFSSGGPEAIRSVLKSNGIFKNAEQYSQDDVPRKGIYILVETKYKTPEMPAVVFGYASVATLTLLPAWSNHDGFDIYYNVYVDGELQKTYQYESRRFIAMWIVLLPLIWINLMTSDEDDAFAAITYNFINDSRDLFEGLNH